MTTQCLPLPPISYDPPRPSPGAQTSALLTQNLETLWAHPCSHIKLVLGRREVQYPPQACLVPTSRSCYTHSPQHIHVECVNLRQPHFLSSLGSDRLGDMTRTALPLGLSTGFPHQTFSSQQPSLDINLPDPDGVRTPSGHPVLPFPSFSSVGCWELFLYS